MADYGRITIKDGKNYFYDDKTKQFGKEVKLKVGDTALDRNGKRNMWDGSKWVPTFEFSNKRNGSYIYNGQFWRDKEGLRLADDNVIKLGNGNYKRLNPDGTETYLMRNGQFTEQGNALDDHFKENMLQGNVYDVRISDVNGKKFSKARTIRQDQGRSDLANEIHIGWRNDTNFDTDQRSINNDSKEVLANRKEAIDAAESYKPQTTWLQKAKANTAERDNQTIQKYQYNDFRKKELAKPEEGDGTGSMLLRKKPVDYTRFNPEIGLTAETKEERLARRENEIAQKYIQEHGEDDWNNVVKGAQNIETSKSLQRGADNLAIAGTIAMEAPVLMYAATQVPAAIQASKAYRLYNIAKAGKLNTAIKLHNLAETGSATGGIWSHIAQNTARKGLQLGGSYAGYAGSQKLADDYLLPHIENEHVKQAVGLGITGVGMALGGGTTNLATSLLRPKGRTLEFFKSGMYDLGNNVVDNLKFASAYGASSYVPGVKDSEFAKFVLSSAGHGGLNYATNKLAKNLNTTINTNKDKLIEKIYDIKNNPLSETKLSLLNNAENAVSKLDKASKVGERLNKILNGQQNYVRQDDKLIRHVYSGVPQSALGYLGMNLVGNTGQLIDEQLGTNISQTPQFEFATMLLGNRLGKEALNIGSYGLRAGSGGDTSVGRVIGNEMSALRYHKGKIKRKINDILFSEVFDPKKIDQDISQFREFTGNQFKKGDQPDHQVQHTVTKAEIHQLERSNPKLASMLKYGYSAGQFDPISMNNEGVIYLGSHQAGRNPSISESATTKEIVSGLTQYLAGERQGGAYHDYITEKGLKDLENFDLMKSKFQDKQGNVHSTFVKIGNKYYVNPKAKQNLISSRQKDFNLTDPFEGPTGKDYVMQSNVAGHLSLPLVGENSILRFAVDTNGYGDTTKSYNSEYKGSQTPDKSLWAKLKESVKHTITTLPGQVLDDTSSPIHISHSELNPETLQNGFSKQGNLPMNTAGQIKRNPKKIRKIQTKANIDALSKNPFEIQSSKVQEAKRNAEYINNFYMNFKGVLDKVYQENPLKMVGTVFDPQKGMYKASVNNFGKNDLKQLKAKVTKDLPKKYKDLFDKIYVKNEKGEYQIDEASLKEFQNELQQYYKETNYLKLSKGQKRARRIMESLQSEDNVNLPKRFKTRFEQLTKNPESTSSDFYKFEQELARYYGRTKIDKVLDKFLDKVDQTNKVVQHYIPNIYIPDDISVLKHKGGKLEQIKQLKQGGPINNNPKTWEEYQKQNRNGQRKNLEKH